MKEFTYWPNDMFLATPTQYEDAVLTEQDGADYIFYIMGGA